ncbi:MAG: glycosyltransferase family 9 protein, partial [Chthoniobacterales bacterium]
MSRILVIRGGALGDFILTLPAIRLLRDAFPTAHLEVLGYKHIAILAELGGFADGTRSIESGALSSFFARDGELAPELIEYFGSFQQVVSYLFDPDGIFEANLRRAGVRQLVVGSPRISGPEH